MTSRYWQHLARQLIPFFFINTVAFSSVLLSWLIDWLNYWVSKTTPRNSVSSTSLNIDAPSPIPSPSGENPIHALEAHYVNTLLVDGQLKLTVSEPRQRSYYPPSMDVQWGRYMRADINEGLGAGMNMDLHVCACELFYNLVGTSIHPNNLMALNGSPSAACMKAAESCSILKAALSYDASNVYARHIVALPLLRQSQVRFICIGAGGPILLRMLYLCSKGFWGDAYTGIKTWVRAVVMIACPLKHAVMHPVPILPCVGEFLKHWGVGSARRQRPHVIRRITAKTAFTLRSCIRQYAAHAAHATQGTNLKNFANCIESLAAVLTLNAQEERQPRETFWAYLGQDNMNVHRAVLEDMTCTFINTVNTLELSVYGIDHPLIIPDPRQGNTLLILLNWVTYIGRWITSFKMTPPQIPPHDGVLAYPSMIQPDDEALLGGACKKTFIKLNVSHADIFDMLTRHETLPTLYNIINTILEEKE